MPPVFHPDCPSRLNPLRIGDKWSALVVACLADGPRRFGELRTSLPRVTPKVLTETLRALERDGYVTRTVHAETPPRVEYALTPLGRTLLPLLDAAREWCAENIDAVRAARAAAGAA